MADEKPPQDTMEKIQAFEAGMDARAQAAGLAEKQRMEQIDRDHPVHPDADKIRAEQMHAESSQGLNELAVACRHPLMTQAVMAMSEMIASGSISAAVEAAGDVSKQCTAVNKELAARGAER